jgi:hypothetical protein
VYSVLKSMCVEHWYFLNLVNSDFCEAGGWGREKGNDDCGRSALRFCLKKFVAVFHFTKKDKFKMPIVHFVGEILSVTSSLEELSVTWAIVPGNAAWYLKRGVGSGETQTCETVVTTGKSVIAHPVDCQYATQSSEGWPVFVCEVCFSFIFFRCFSCGNAINFFSLENQGVGTL